MDRGVSYLDVSSETTLLLFRDHNDHGQHPASLSSDIAGLENVPIHPTSIHPTFTLLIPPNGLNSTTKPCLPGNFEA